MRLPLHGVRVVDLTKIWAGPYGTKLLADLGAEVIKVEGPERAPGLPYYRSTHFDEFNVNKYDISLNLATPRGKEIFIQLVKIADVVVENFSARVMKNLGLDYPVLSQIKPDIIMMSMPGFGMTGPYRDYVAYGTMLEPMTGLSQLTGYPDGPPIRAAVAYGDPTGGLNCAFGLLAAIHYRRRTGKGQFIDVSQLEGTACLVGEVLMDYVMNRRVQTRMANRHPSMAPHGCFRCKGDDEWIAISVGSDEEWRNFKRALGEPVWAQDERFATVLGRLACQDKLNKHIEEWTKEHDHYEAMRILQENGVSAGAALTNIEMHVDPHLKARGFFEQVDHPLAGSRPFFFTAAKYSKTPAELRMPFPCFSQHNYHILGQYLGMSKQEIDKLTEEGVLGVSELEDLMRAAGNEQKT